MAVVRFFGNNLMLISAFDPTFNKMIQIWFEDQGEIFLVVRYCAGGGSKDYVMICSFEEWVDLIGALPVMADITAFRKLQLPTRGTLDTGLLTKLRNSLPPKAEWMFMCLENHQPHSYRKNVISRWQKLLRELTVYPTPPDMRQWYDKDSFVIPVPAESLVQYGIGDEPADFDEMFQKFAGKYVGFGPLPPWWEEDNQNMRSCRIPRTDGSMTGGAY